jgi:hypothetical protein
MALFQRQAPQVTAICQLPRLSGHRCLMKLHVVRQASRKTTVAPHAPVQSCVVPDFSLVLEARPLTSNMSSSG